MYTLGEEFHINHGSFTREVLDATAHSQICTITPDLTNSMDTTVSPAPFPSVPDLTPMPSFQCTTPAPEMIPLSQIKLEAAPMSPSAFNSQVIQQINQLQDQGHNNLSSPSTQNSPPITLKLEPMTVPIQVLPSPLPPLQQTLPPFLPFQSFPDFVSAAMHQPTPPPPAPPPAHHQQHDSASSHQLPQQARDNSAPVNGDQQANAFIMQQLYQQYIMYLQNEITCLRQTAPPPQLLQQMLQLQQLQQMQQLSQPTQHNVPTPAINIPMVPISPSTYPATFSSTPYAAVSDPAVVPSLVSSPAGSPPTSAAASPVMTPRSATNNSPPPLSKSANSIPAPNPAPRPQTQQKPMKFHLVQYSKQPTVEEFEARANNGLSPPDSPSQQSSTFNKLQINPELLTMKQSEAAKILGISPSMLSKRWREAMNGRKWPYRVHRKLQKEINSIVTLMDDNSPPGGSPVTSPVLSPVISPINSPKADAAPSSADMERRLKLLSMYKDINSTSAYI